MVVLTVCGYSFLRGYRKLKELERVDEQVRQEHCLLEVLGWVSYHGGFPLLPRPASLGLGIASNCLVLFDASGKSGKVEFTSIKKIDSFVTLTKPNLKNKSFVMWGPLAPMLFRAKTRYFVVISYIDINGEDNNILLESQNAEQSAFLFEKVYSAWRLAKGGRGFKKVAKEETGNL
jgi:hypothetical protein